MRGTARLGQGVRREAESEGNRCQNSDSTNRNRIQGDLEKFFDRVSHEILMARLARRGADKRLLRIVRRFLRAGLMQQGICVDRHVGTPQGGPLAPPTILQTGS